MIKTLTFPNLDLSKYHSQTQKIKHLTEGYVFENAFCPVCGSPILKYEENHYCADFYCDKCKEDYELKSKKNKFGKKIVDGEYNKMIEKINSNKPSNFFFLAYKDGAVVDLFTIPKFFFTPAIIEKRKPLSENARRAGWVGCNILYNQLPNSAKIFYVRDGVVADAESVVENYKKVSFVAEKPLESKGWLLDVMFCIENLHKEFFELDDVYGCANFLKRQHPENNYIQAKIRQQLQFLRNKGFVEFVGRGRYRLVK